MSNDATKVIGEATGYVLDATLAQAVETCPHCRHDILVGEQYCSQCGYQRGTWGGEQPTPAETGDAVLILRTGDREWPVYAGTTVLGRGDVDVQLDDAYASRRHAQIEAGAGACTVTDLGSSNGTFLDGERLAPNVGTPLAAGQVIKIGNAELVVELPVATESADLIADATEVAEIVASAAETVTEEPASETAGDESATLADTSAWRLTGERGEFDLRVGANIFGRKAEKCDFVIDGDGYISGAHCRLDADSSALTITDLSSTNGTSVNGEKLEAGVECPLAAGDQIIMGQTALVVVWIEADAVPEVGAGDEPAAAGEQA